MTQMRPTRGVRRGAVTRCVILTAAAGRRPDSLVRGLKQRDLSVLVVDDAAQAMVALAEPGRQALIVDQPARHNLLADLLGAVRRYYPQTICWQYEPSGRGLLPLDTAAATTDRPDSAAAERAAPPAGVPRRRRRDAQARGDRQAPQADRSTPPRTPPAVLEVTPEELEMLLGPAGDDDDAPPRDRRH